MRVADVIGPADSPGAYAVAISDATECFAPDHPMVSITSPVTALMPTGITNPATVVMMTTLRVIGGNIEHLPGVDAVRVVKAIDIGNDVGVHIVLPADAVERFAIVNPVSCSARGRSN